MRFIIEQIIIFVMLSNQSFNDNNLPLKYNPAFGGISFPVIDLLSTPYVRVYHAMTFKNFHKNKDLKIQKGVYKITCLTTGKFYIGSTTVSFYTRLYSHICRLRAGKSLSKKLQRAYNKYGEDNFIISIIEVLEENKEIRERESFYIKTLFKLEKSVNYFNLYSLNICKEAGSSLGRKQTEKTKRLLSLKNKGTYAGEKHPLWGTKREPTFLGKKHSEESLIKMRTKRKKPVTAERRKQMSEQMSGEKHPMFGVPLNENRKRALDRTGQISNLRKPVLMILNENIIKEYECILHAMRDGHSSSHIKSCCIGKRNFHHGFQWKFKDYQP